MADSTTPHTKPHSPFPQLSSRIHPKPTTTTNKGKSCSALLFKFLFLSLFLVAIPLFPSQAPEFVSQTILTKFWELLHLLFIGIAVAYGLFSSRRNVEIEPHLETHPSSVVVDNSSESSYVSKMFPDSAIFGDGVEIPCGYGEKSEVHCWDPQYLCSNGNGAGAVGVLDEQFNKKTQFLSVSGGGDSNFGYSVACDGNNVVQSWNSEYYHSEPVVVVAQPSYGTAGECGGVVGYKPLGLPVRSLRSGAREVDGGRCTNESDSSSGSRVSSRSSDQSCRDREFGDLDPSDLDNKFDAAAVGGGGCGSASPVQWRSRSRRTERGRRQGNVAHPPHFRPLSVDETEIEAFNSSRPLQSTTSFFSRTGMYSSLDSMSSDNTNFQVEEMRRKEASYAPASEMMNFQEEGMEPKTSYMPAMENMNFREEYMGKRNTSYVAASENNMNFQETDMGQRKTYYAPALENLDFQEADLGKKISQGSSSRNGSMKAKGKYAAVSYPSHFRPMSGNETPFESLGSQSFQSAGSFSSHTSMQSSLDSISSDNVNFQEEDMEQEKSSLIHALENVNSEEQDMGQKKPFFVHASENVNFQEEEDMAQQETSYVHAAESMNFDEADSGKISRVSSSRLGRMGIKGKRVAVSHPSHFRPMSVDETQFESLSSQSFQSMGSFSSQTSLGSSLDSTSLENMNLVKEDSGEKKSSRGSSSSNSPSPLARSDGETSLQPYHARGHSIGSLLQDDMKSNMNDDLRGLNEIEGEDPSGNRKSVVHALQSDSGKATSVAKASSRGKSVRTRRAGGLTSGTMRIGETSSKQTDEKVEKKLNNVESVLMRKDKVKSEEADLLLKGISKKKLESYSAKPEVTFSNLHKRDKPEPSKKVSKEDLDIEFENIEVSSDEDVMSECVNDSGLDSEVDKKASEFIAKFKAQIRLQKSGSVERSKGQKTIGNYIR